MKFKIDRKLLLDTLNIVSMAMVGRSTLPVLETVQFAGADRLTLTATNLEIGIKKTIDADIIEPGIGLIPGKLLIGLITSFQSDLVEVETTPRSVNLKCSKAKSTLQTLDPEDFPNFSRPDLEWLSLPTDDFKQAVSQTLPAVSTDKGRLILNNLYLHRCKSGNLRLVGADGFRVTRYDLPLDTEFTALIPGAAAHVLLKLITRNIKIAVDQNRSVFFASDDLFVRIAQMDGKFPDYESLVNSCRFDKTVQFNSIELLKALKGGKAIASTTSDKVLPIVKLKIGNNKIRISFTSEIGSFDEEIDAITQGDIDIEFSIDFLQDALEACCLSMVKMSFLRPVAPVDFEPVVDNPKFRTLLMPVSTR